MPFYYLMYDICYTFFSVIINFTRMFVMGSKPGLVTIIRFEK